MTPSHTRLKAVHTTNFKPRRKKELLFSNNSKRHPRRVTGSYWPDLRQMPITEPNIIVKGIRWVDWPSQYDMTTSGARNR